MQMQDAGRETAASQVPLVARYPLLTGMLIGLIYLPAAYAILSSHARLPSVALMCGLSFAVAFLAAAVPALIRRRHGLLADRVGWLVFVLVLQFAVSLVLIQPGDAILNEPSGQAAGGQTLPGDGLSLTGWHMIILGHGAILAAPAALLGILLAETLAERRLRRDRAQTAAPPESVDCAAESVVSQFIARHCVLATVVLLLPLAVLPAVPVTYDPNTMADPDAAQPGLGLLAAAAVLPMAVAAVLTNLRRRVGLHRPWDLLPVIIAPPMLLVFTVWADGLLYYNDPMFFDHGSVPDLWTRLQRAADAISRFAGWREVSLVLSIFATVPGAIVGTGLAWAWRGVRRRTAS